MKLKELRIVLLLVFIFVNVVVSMIWHLSQLQAQLIEADAIKTAKIYTETLTQFRSLYTSEVVERAITFGMNVTHDYATRADAIPLPATLSMLLGNEMGMQVSGVSSRLYSPYPFPWRNHNQTELADTFDKNAWDHLTVEPEKPYYQFQNQGDLSILQYATADVMRSQCIVCHNTHPDSPKTDWKVGDVRGVLTVTLPLSEIKAKTNAELKSTSIAYSLVGFGIMAICCIVIIKLRNQSQVLANQVNERTAELNAELNEHQRTIAFLTESEERFRLGIEASPAAMIMVDEIGIILNTNQQAEKLFDYSKDKLVGNTIEILIPHDTSSKHPALRNAFMENPASRTMAGRDIHAKNGKGDVFPVEVGLNPIQTHNGMIILCSIVDLTERKKKEQIILDQSKQLNVANVLLSEQATTDSLTGLANRRKLFSQLELLLILARRKDHSTSFMLADIDYFKKYNDDFGHPSGDEALSTVAHTLTSVARDSDLVARYGGEEFAILLPETDLEGAIYSGERLRKSIENITGMERNITMSIGIATLRLKQNDVIDIEYIISEFIGEADKALYYSKKNGRNKVTHFGNIDGKEK